MCSAALEAFGASRTLSASIQHAKSEEVGCRTSEPFDSVIMSVQDKLICVLLVMPHCMLSMQLFLSEIVKFRFDLK